MSNPTIIAIIEKHSTSSLSAEEEVILHAWLESVSPEEFHRTLEDCQNLPARLKEFPAMSQAFAHTLETRLSAFDNQEEKNIAKTIYLSAWKNGWKKWASIAAAVILLFSAGAYLWITHSAKPGAGSLQALHNNDVPNDVAPGLDGAILTLADGRQIVLDSTRNGALATEGNTKITKLSNGRLSYTALAERSSKILYNTLTTPRGRKTSVVLADGTQVWLDAASYLKYPTSFSGKDRIVEISGEAYFEVAKSTVPFIVKKSGSDYRIQVLGTSFNVNAYDDEQTITTTLLTGSVKVLTGPVKILTGSVEKGGAVKILTPGQQAILDKSRKEGAIELLPAADIATAMAWKNGKFSFDRADIQTVMRQISRWYDVDVEYKGTITQHFGGTISRDVNVSQIFKMLELTGAVKFTIEGRKIEVMP